MTAEHAGGIAAGVDAVRTRAVSAEELAVAALDALERLDGDVGAFTAVAPERVLADARAVDRLAAEGRAGPLAGVPVGVKDLVDVAGLPSSYGTPAIPARRATRDARCVERLRAAGALVIGKTRTSELAWRPDTPPTANPRFPDLIPGGSSGGSAAAVAAGIVPAALGTDTGGSIRWPAAMCGIVGVKPTYGAVSLGGVLPCSPSLDHVGPLAGTVADARAVLAALVGHDPADPASAPAPVLAALAGRLASGERTLSLSGRRLGVLREPVFTPAGEEAAKRFEEAVEAVRAAGADVRELRLPALRFAVGAIAAISLADGALLADTVLDPDELAADVRSELELAAALPASLVVRAGQVRRLLQLEVHRLFREQELEALLAPATAGPPVTRDGLERGLQPPDGTTRSAVDLGVRTFYLANLTGQPACVVSARSSPRPFALQLVGRPFEDDRLLALAAAVEPLLDTSA